MKTKLAPLDLCVVICFYMTALTDGRGYRTRASTAVLHMSRICPTQTIRLDHFDKFELTSGAWSVPEFVSPGALTCTAHFMTGNNDHGICFHNNGDFLINSESGVELHVFTSRLGPEKTFDSEHHNFTSWCTEESMVSVELTIGRHRGQAGDFKFNFTLTNVTKQSITKHYRMDSFKHCDRSHRLQAGEEIRISGQSYPTSGDLTASCQLTFSTTSEDEYAELCLYAEDYRTTENCLSSLVISGFHSRFWPEVQELGCNDSQSQLPAEQEMCSADKNFIFNLTRTSTSDTGVTFTLVVKAKWHSHWKMLSREKSDLRSLAFIKGVTYFIAAFDSLVGIAAAVLANMLRHPRSFWKNWAESMNPDGMCEAVRYEVTYPEMSCSQEPEVMTDVKFY